MRESLLLLTLALNTFAAGPLIFGARGGVPVVNSVSNVTTSALGLAPFSQSYLIGPTAGVRLPFGFSIEGDALFSRQTLNLGQIAGLTAAGTHADSWEFPVMLKFTAGRQFIAPVLGAGFSVRHINNFSGLNALPSFLLTGSTAANTFGFVAGGGLRFKAGPVNITPEIRFTHWNGNGLAQSMLNLISPASNEAQVLIGLTF